MNLKSSYQREDFLNFLNDFLPSFKRDVRNVSSAGTQAIKNSQLLGQCPELDLEIYEFAHQGSGGKRVSLTRDGFRIMKNHATYRALAVFYSEDTDDWRLSLMTASPDINPKGKVDLSFSNPRRYSFFLGPQARVNTPKKYLVNSGKVKDLNDLLQRFNVEIVTKEFFSNYRNLYENLSTYLDKDHAFQAVANDSDFGTDNFAKKLLGQIVFLYFVQRKGWLGAKAEDSVTKGDQNFMRSLFNRCLDENKNFFNDFLEPLFYDALNRRPERAANFYRELFRGQIPFLNGGLFEPLPNYDWQKSFLHIPNEIFSTIPNSPESGSGILDIFDLYNFTVDESDAVDQEVSVDPEMLGKVFENLLPENLRKGKGTYYTPREIVHYMCHESLIKHLTNDAKIEEKKIRDLANLYEIPLGSNEIKTATHWEGEKKDILKSLSTIRIVDPACGSGAFLIGMLQEIVKLHHTLDPMVDDYHLRRKIIENSIYGVDIDPGAVEIAKLRLWLALVVDYELPVIEPLPNLDYKIMQGNSLIEEFEGINFYDNEESDQRSPKLINFNEERQKKIQELEAKKQEYFSAVNSDKKSTKQEIDGLIKWLVEDSLSQRSNVLRQQWSKHAYAQHQLSGNQVSEYYMKNIQNVLTRGKIDEEIKNISNHRHTRSYFLWKLFFIEVFGEKGGFDVVIANPPYISIEKFARSKQQGEWRDKFKTFASRGDVYCLFYEQGISLLKEGGVLAYISSNKFQRTGYGRNLREFLSARCIYAIVDFCELPVFEAATDPLVIILSNAPATEDEFQALVVKSESAIKSLYSEISSRGMKFTSSALRPEGWTLEGDQKLVDKLRSTGISLGEFVDNQIYYGVKTGFNEAFVINRETRDRLIKEDNKSQELIKPWIRGVDIKRWTFEFQELYVIIFPHGFHEKLTNYPAILRHLNTYEQRLKARGQCRNSRNNATEGQHHWLELDNNPTLSYLEAFNKPKIVFNETSKNLHAYLDVEGNIINKTGFIILSTEALYILSVMNSLVMDWYFRTTFPSWGDPWSGGRIQFRGNLMKRIPIPIANESHKRTLTELAQLAGTFASKGDIEKLSAVELKIDEIVYGLFRLTKDEIATIKGNK